MSNPAAMADSPCSGSRMPDGTPAAVIAEPAGEVLPIPASQARPDRGGRHPGSLAIAAGHAWQTALGRYPGAKGGAGVWQAIINQIPPHEVWIEAFAGSGAVTRHKRPAPVANLILDLDPGVVAAWQAVPGVTAICADALAWLPGYPWTGREVVYLDPPYLRSVRSCQRDYYRHEFATEGEHAALLATLARLPVRVMLSGYPSALYDRLLCGWRTITFQTVTRRGRKVTECLWLNFPEPLALHDYRFLGRGFRERERIKRKKARWRARLLRLPMLERAAILEAVAEVAALAGQGNPPGPAAISGDAGQLRSPEAARRDPIARTAGAAGRKPASQSKTA